MVCETNFRFVIFYRQWHFTKINEIKNTNHNTDNKHSNEGEKQMEAANEFS